MEPRNLQIFPPVSVKVVNLFIITVAIILVEDCRNVLSIATCKNCVVFPFPTKNSSEVGEQLKRVKFKNTTSNTTRIDRVFKLDSAIFENYLENFDYSIIPGFRHEDDFENWTVPDEVKDNFVPLYMSGFDKKNRPIWVMQYGKNNFEKFATGGHKKWNLFHKYMRYSSYNAIKSMAIRSTDKNRVNQLIHIIDFEGVTPKSLLNPAVLKLQLQVISDYRRYAETYNYKVFVINLNLVSENLLNLARFFLLRLLDKLVIYGTNKAWWVPQILTMLPKDSLPEKYGGSKGFKPLYTIS